MIITRSDIDGISDLKQSLNQHFEMKDLSRLNYSLGLEILSNSTSYYLSQAKYISDILSRAGLTNCKTTSTLLETNLKLAHLDDTPLSDDTLYRQLVGSLVYLTVTRLDIAYDIHQVTKFMSAPRSAHYADVLRILRYLKGVMFHGLHFSSTSSLKLQAYFDVD